MQTVVVQSRKIFASGFCAFGQTLIFFCSFSSRHPAGKGEAQFSVQSASKQWVFFLSRRNLAAQSWIPCWAQGTKYFYSYKTISWKKPVLLVLFFRFWPKLQFLDDGKNTIGHSWMKEPWGVCTHTYVPLLFALFFSFSLGFSPPLSGMFRRPTAGWDASPRGIITIALRLFCSSSFLPNKSGLMCQGQKRERSECAYSNVLKMRKLFFHLVALNLMQVLHYISTLKTKFRKIFS